MPCVPDPVDSEQRVFGGSIFLQRLPHAQKPLTPELYAMLDEIRQPYDRFQDAR
jgi:hypothetical protein